MGKQCEKRSDTDKGKARKKTRKYGGERTILVRRRMITERGERITKRRTNKQFWN
jgi:hypothetical protein